MTVTSHWNKETLNVWWTGPCENTQSDWVEVPFIIYNLLWYFYLFLTFLVFRHSTSLLIRRPFLCLSHLCVVMYGGENKYLTPCRFRKFGHLQRNVWSIIVMGRSILTVRDRISTKTSRKLHFITVILCICIIQTFPFLPMSKGTILVTLMCERFGFVFWNREITDIPI